MENKKLIKILLKDMGELEELISDVKSNGNFDAMEMEFIHTRAKGVLQLLHLLDARGDTVTKMSRTFQDKEELRESKSINQKEALAEEEFQPEKMKPERKEPDEQKTHEPDSEAVSKHEDQSADIHSDTAREIRTQEDGDRDEDEMLEEEDERTEANSRLGDSFLKGKSVNDLITDQHKLEFKLSNRPVTSIKAAIGINDRFQYMRELFDSDPQKFEDAVETLDSMGNINEAVDYLRRNFKWKKTETGLKFVNLVKRRFQGSADH